MAGAGKLTKAAECNFVHLDDNWKTYVRKEGDMSVKWFRNWGFLPQEYQKLREDIDRSRGLHCPAHAPLPSSSPPLHLPPLPCAPQNTQLPFPTTTSREIGWRSSQRDCTLEVFGRWARPKVSILHHLNWPHDAVD